MRYPFDSEEAQELNKKIFETMYYFALKVYQLLLGNVITDVINRHLVNWLRSMAHTRHTKDHQLVKANYSMTCGE